MPSTLPPWLRTTSAVVGLAIIATQAAGHLLYGREPTMALLVVAVVMVGLVSPDKLERFLPGGDQPAPPAPPEPPAVEPPGEQESTS